jgi:hypothetical protein
MMLNNRDRFSRGLEFLAGGLGPFVHARMAVSPAGQNWVEALAARDSSRFGGQRRYSLSDPRFLLRVVTDEWGAFKDQLSRVERSFAIELRDAGNKWAHGETLSADDTYRALDTMERLLTAVGAAEQASQVRRIRTDLQPPPQAQRGSDTSGQFPSTANAAARVGPPGHARADEPGAGQAVPATAAPADAGRAQAARLIDHALLLAHLSSNENLKLHALDRAVGTLAATDPDKAEGAARSITVESLQGSALDHVVEALIPTDPDRAKRVALSIADDYTRECALGHIAEALAVTDLDQAIQVVEWSITIDHPKAAALGRVAKALAATDPGQAERIALSITDTDARESALGHIAWVLAAADPDEAERVAREITDGFAQASALGDIAEVLAPADPERAERIAQSVTSEYKEFVLCRVAHGLAGTDPDRAGRLIDNAERIAWAITSEEPRELALIDIAAVLATTDAGRAERIAWSITDEGLRASALHFLTQEVAGSDPDRAERIAQSITGKGYWHTLETWRASALRHVAEALAATDPDRAERIAWSITDADARLFALGHIAAAVAGSDPDRAERIAWSVTGGSTEQDMNESLSGSWSITSEHAKAWALCGVARVLAATGPERAARLIADAEQLALSAADEGARINALLDAAKAFSVGPAPNDGPPGDWASITAVRLLMLTRR